MTAQPDLFDASPSLATAHGIAIRDAIYAAGRKYGRFTSDNCREFLPDLTAKWLAMRPNRMGAVLMHCEEAGEIVFVSYVKSSRKEARGRDIKLWRLA